MDKGRMVALRINKVHNAGDHEYRTDKRQGHFPLDQFFPEGDEELDFYQEFVKEFETDINFLLVAVENEESVQTSQYKT